MKVKLGEVVLVDYPYSDGTGSKVRPYVVVQNDHNNARLHNTVVVMVTSRITHAESEPTQFLVRSQTPEGLQASFLMDSSVQCENINTVDSSLIRRKIGNLPSELIDELNQCLRASLGLST